MGALSSVKSSGQFAPANGGFDVMVTINCTASGDVTVTGPSLAAGSSTAVATLTISLLAGDSVSCLASKVLWVSGSFLVMSP